MSFAVAEAFFSLASITRVLSICLLYSAMVATTRFRDREPIHFVCRCGRQLANPFSQNSNLSVQLSSMRLQMPLAILPLVLLASASAVARNVGKPACVSGVTLLTPSTANWIREMGTVKANCVRDCKSKGCLPVRPHRVRSLRSSGWLNVAV